MKTPATAEKFVLVSNEFGFPLYIALVNGEIEATENETEAEVFSIEDKLSAAKLPYYRGTTGYAGLNFEKI